MESHGIYPDVIADRYELQEMISEGGMSAVFRCIDREINADCAIKLLALEEILSPQGRERFEHECQMLTHFDHPNIIHNLDYGIYEDIPYLVMEICVDHQGRPFTLRQLQLQSGGRLDLAAIEMLLPQILQGMTLFHQHGLVHRDIKPENILLQRVKDDKLIPKIIDFGLVALTDDKTLQERMMLSLQMQEQQAAAQKVVGTLNYMSPEQMAGQPVNARSDVYSLGLMVFRLLTGKSHPSEAPTILSDEGMPRWIENLVDRAMQDDPQDRPADATEMLQILPEEIRDIAFVDKADRDAPTVHQLRESANTIVLAEPIADRYQVLDEIEQDPPWTHFLCRDLESGEMRTLMRLETDEEEDSNVIQRFIHECEFLAGISHPNVIRVTDYGHEFGQLYVILEHCPDPKGFAGSLAELQETTPGHRLDPSQIDSIVPPLIAAVADLHRHGLIHRDIHPGNVLLTVDKNGDYIPKLTNFGGMNLTTDEGLKIMPRYSVSRLINTTAEPDTAIIGTYEYMSPEQKQGRKVDQRSDVYSLGLMVYRLATGFERIGFQLPSEVNPELSEWVDQVCRLALPDRPEERSETAEELYRSLPEELRSEELDVVEKTSVGEDPEEDAAPQGEDTDQGLIKGDGEETEQDTPLPAIREEKLVPIEELEDLEELPAPFEPEPDVHTLETSAVKEDFPEDVPLARAKPDEPVAEDDIVRTRSISLDRDSLIPKAKPVERPPKAKPIDPPPGPESVPIEPDVAVEQGSQGELSPLVPVIQEPQRFKRKRRRSRARSFYIRNRRYIPLAVIALGVFIASVVTHFSLNSWIRDRFQLFGEGRTDRGNKFSEYMRHGKAALRKDKIELARDYGNKAATVAQGHPREKELVNRLFADINARALELNTPPVKPTPPKTTPVPPPLPKPKPAPKPKPPPAMASLGPNLTRTAPPLKQPEEWRAHTANITLSRIAEGVFDMGASRTRTNGRIGPWPIKEDWGPVRRVKISYGFWMGRTEVTQQQYERVLGMGNNPSKDRNPLKPVDSVDWHQAASFCSTLTANEGSSLPDGYVYRLPTEAEWEYTARAGSTGAYCCGDSLEELSKYAWTWIAPEKRSLAFPPRHPVAKKEPNAWGLYDMHGNVSEWCLDYVAFDGTHIVSSLTNETLDPVSTRGPARVYRGGSVRTSAINSHVAARMLTQPNSTAPDRGFRIVLAPRIHMPDNGAATP